MRLVCVGHAAFDTTLPVVSYPVENLKYRIEKNIECGGGPASNAAYLLAKWGMDTTFVGVIGKDYYGDRIIEEFKSIGVDTSLIERNENVNTASSYIIANTSNGSRTIITAKTPRINKLSNNIDIKCDGILVDGEHFETALEVLDNNPDAISVLDAGRLNDATRALGKKVTYVVCSKTFAEDFSELKINVNKMSSLIDAYENLVTYFKTNVIITLEDMGSFTKTHEKYMIIPSISVKAVDSTGAGDIFHGAFMYFIMNNYSVYDAIEYASVAGALSVTKIGSRFAIPELEEVKTRKEVEYEVI